MNAYKRLKEIKTKKISESAHDFFPLIHSFGKSEQLLNFVNVWMFEDPIEMPKTVTCGYFGIYLYENPFFPTKTGKFKALRT